MSRTVSAPDFAALATFSFAFWVVLFFTMGVSVLFPRRVSVSSYQSPAWGRGSATNCGKKLTNGPQTSG
jgi:hypothetical protein